MSNWEALVKWSLKQHDGTRSEPQMDEERRQWLQEALQAIAASPTEAQLLQAAITVLKAHMPEGGDIGEEEEEHLMKTFEEIQYLIEDLDNANNLIPMNGVEIISSFLKHKKPSLVQSSCELIATATQNNLKTQQAFLTTLPCLLTIVDNRDYPPSVNVKALYAVSCLTRDFEHGVTQLLALDGMATLRHCLAAEETKLVVKAIFIIMSYYSTAQGEVKEKLIIELPFLVPELVNLIRTGVNDEVKGHALSGLVTMVTHHQRAIEECKRDEIGLKSVLLTLSQSLSPEDHEDELSSIKTLLETCFQ